MKVVVSVSGRFWAFDLAAQLERQGHLQRLITTYPAFMAERWNVPGNKVSSVLSAELISRAWRKIAGSSRHASAPDFLMAEYFDWRAARLLPRDADIFVGWSNFSLRALRQANALGMATVLEHGSSHIEYQRDILNEEYANWNLPLPVTDERPVRKEVLEYAEAGHIALPSRFAMRTFVDKGVPESKILYVPYGVDLSSFRQLPKTDSIFRIVFAGGLTLRKGVHYLLQAFAELALPDSELLLLGTVHDEIKPFLAKYPDRVRANGPVPQADLHKYYSNSSVFVLDSVEDGFGMVVAQAMACGLPAIVSENTGAADLVRDGEDGFVIPIRNTQILKEKLQHLYDNPETRDRMGRSAKLRVASGFTWDDYGRRMIEEYERILQKGRSSDRISS